MTRAHRLYDLLTSHGAMTSRQAADQLAEPWDCIASMLSAMEKRGLVQVVGRRPATRGYAKVYAAVPEKVLQPAPVLRAAIEPRHAPEPIPTHAKRQPLRYVTIGRQTFAVMWDGSR